MTFPVAVALFATVVAAVTDLRQFRIPNWLTLPLLPLGLLYHISVGGLDGVMASGMGALVGFTLLFPLYLTGGMGAGDVKLMAGLGAWLKTTPTLEVLVISCLFAGAYALVLLVVNRRPSQSKAAHVARRVEAGVASADRRIRLIPFGVMIAAGLVVVLACRHWPS